LRIGGTSIFRELGALTGLVFLCISLSLLSPDFLRLSNLINVMRQVTVIAIMTAGMTFVILTAGIDLSVGSILGLTSCIMAGLIKSLGIPVCLSVGAGLLLGALLGATNGLLITKARLPPFIATLGMMSVARGLAYVYTHGAPIYGLPSSFRFLGEGMWGPLPFPVLLMVLVFSTAHLVLTRTRLGRYAYAIGGNEEATRLSGVPVDRYKLWVYCISGFLAAVSGAILAARLDSAVPVAGTGSELDVIAAVVIGGTSLMGGEGKVTGSLIGALIMGVVRNGLNLLLVSPYWQSVVIGLIILLAVAVDLLRRRI